MDSLSLVRQLIYFGRMNVSVVLRLILPWNGLTWPPQCDCISLQVWDEYCLNNGDEYIFLWHKPLNLSRIIWIHSSQCNITFTLEEMNDSLVLRHNVIAHLFKDVMDTASATRMVMFSLGHKALDLPRMGQIHSSQCNDYFGRNKRHPSVTVQFT